MNRLNRILAPILLPLFLLFPPVAEAYSPEAYPGWLWSGTTYDFDRIEGYGNQGSVNQGVQWLTFGEDYHFTTYLSYRWRLRTNNREYFDAVGPAAGAEITHDFWSAGIQYEWQSFPSLNTKLQYPTLYARWFKQIDLISGPNSHFLGVPVIGFPTYTWGRVTHDFNYFEGIGTMGYIAQAVDWFYLPGDVIFRTQVLYNWRFRTQNELYYNVHGPAAGVELVRGGISGGAMYILDRYTDLGRNVPNFKVYLNIYTDWDLKTVF